MRCATLVLCGIVVVAALLFGFLHPFDTATSFTSDMASLEESLKAVFAKNTSARGNFYDVFDPVIAIYGRTTPALFLEFIAFFVVGLLVFLFAKRAEKNTSLRVPSVILPLLATAFLCTLGNESMLLLLYTDFYDTLYMSSVACTVFNMIGSGLSAFTLVCVSCSLALGNGDDVIEGVDFIEAADVALQGEGSDLRDIR